MSLVIPSCLSFWELCIPFLVLGANYTLAEMTRRRISDFNKFKLGGRLPFGSKIYILIKKDRALRSNLSLPRKDFR